MRVGIRRLRFGIDTRSSIWYNKLQEYFLELLHEVLRRRGSGLRDVVEEEADEHCTQPSVVLVAALHAHRHDDLLELARDQRLRLALRAVFILLAESHEHNGRVAHCFVHRLLN